MHWIALVFALLIAYLFLVLMCMSIFFSSVRNGIKRALHIMVAGEVADDINQ